MRTSCFSAICFAVLAAACTRSDKTVTDSSAGAVDTTRAHPASTIALGDVAGTWHNVARPAEGKDTTSTPTILNAKADTTGWTMVIGKSTVPLHVQVMGDSIVATSDVYPSVRRKGVMVRTVSSYRLQNGKLVGTTVAHYQVKTADSVLVLHSEATRAS
jgi:hypothetical protein